MKKVDEIFEGDTYTHIVRELQESDKNSSFGDRVLPIKYASTNEPKTLPGRNKGLVLMVDAHSDLLAAGSIDSDFDGFNGIIGPGGSFPLLGLEGFEIRPGHNNIVALTGSQIDADPSLRDLAISDRQCLFPDENTGMKLHKNYTYMNCVFECSLLFAQEKLQVSISMSIFYEWLLCTKVFCAFFSTYSWALIFFGKKISVQKQFAICW